MNVYVNDEDAKVLDGFETKLEEDATVVVLPSTAKGPWTPSSIPDGLALALDPEAERELDIRFQAISNQLLRRLADQPNLLYDLRPRQLEELVAELYAREGFEVELTPETHDGGVDLFVVKRTPFGSLLTVIDTKLHRADRPVGVGIVRQMFGVVEARRASAGVIATTSYFSRDAMQFQADVPFRLGLQDFGDLHRMLKNASHR